MIIHFFYNQFRMEVQALISLKSSWLKVDCMIFLIIILLVLRNVYQTIDSPNSGPIELDQSWADTCLSESSFGLIEVLY